MLSTASRGPRIPVDPVFRDSPQFVDEQLCAALGRQVLVKVEAQNPLHSFKGRGAEWFAERLERGMLRMQVSLQ